MTVLSSVRGGSLIVRTLRVVGAMVVATLCVSCSSSKPSADSSSASTDSPRSAATAESTGGDVDTDPSGTTASNNGQPSNDTSGTGSSPAPATDDSAQPADPTTGSAEATTTAAPVDPAAGLALLNGDIDVLTENLGDRAVIEAARTVLADGAADPSLRFAAAFVWANVGDDPAVLVPLLADADRSIALTAAIGVLAQGGAEGFAPLIAALTSDDVLLHYGTGETAWTAATVALVQFTGIATHGPPFDADASQRLLAQQRWQAWLDANAAALKFDAATEQWSIS